MEPLVDDVVAIPIPDLDLIRATLSSAYHYSTVVDLQEQYRKLTQRPTPSNLTKSLQNALTLITAYMQRVEEEDGDIPE